MFELRVIEKAQTFPESAPSDNLHKMSKSVEEYNQKTNKIYWTLFDFEAKIIFHREM